MSQAVFMLGCFIYITFSLFCWLPSSPSDCVVVIATLRCPVMLCGFHFDGVLHSELPLLSSRVNTLSDGGILFGYGAVVNAICTIYSLPTATELKVCCGQSLWASHTYPELVTLQLNALINILIYNISAFYWMALCAESTTDGLGNKSKQNPVAVPPPPSREQGYQDVERARGNMDS